MRRVIFIIVACTLMSATPSFAHDDRRHMNEGGEASPHEDMSAHSHIGGHWRHMHRDWSTPGHHVHSVCYEWDELLGWQWMCR